MFIAYVLNVLIIWWMARKLVALPGL